MNTHPSQTAAVVELRQYRLHPGRRDALIELFEREFVESQEALGMQLIGQFRDLDDPDRFVWLRGFADMPARAAALSAFYGGPVWRAHRDAANATMLDSDDVLLLRPAGPERGFACEPRPDRGDGSELVTATLCHLHAPVDSGFIEFFERQLAPALAAAGSPVSAALATEYADNNFPALPVREGEHLFVWFGRFADEDAQRRSAAQIGGTPQWQALLARLACEPQVLRLAPTPRSRLCAAASTIAA